MFFELFLVFGVWLVILFFAAFLWALLKNHLKIFWHSLCTPKIFKQAHSKKNKLYYCHICYVISDKKGFCHQHGFPNPFTRGKSAELERYRELQKQYDSSSGY